MATKRTPIKRDHRHRFTQKALELIAELKEAKDGERWWRLHNLLHNELGCRPWEWPCVEDPEADRNYEAHPDALALWAALERAR
jgi:hypothetical protein